MWFGEQQLLNISFLKSTIGRLFDVGFGQSCTLIYFFVWILSECQQRAKAVWLSLMHTMECACTPWKWFGIWTTIPVNLAEWFGLGFLSKIRQIIHVCAVIVLIHSILRLGGCSGFVFPFWIFGKDFFFLFLLGGFSAKLLSL